MKGYLKYPKYLDFKSILRKYMATINKNLFQRIQDIFCKEIGCKE